MKHPWVTRRGSWPLRTVKEMVRMGDTPELPPVLPDLMSTLNVLDIPRQVDILSPTQFASWKQSYPDQDFAFSGNSLTVGFKPKLDMTHCLLI